MRIFNICESCSSSETIAWYGIWCNNVILCINGCEVIFH
jgi:hypothetical protein